MVTKIKLALICFLLVTLYYGAAATQRSHTRSSNPLQLADPGIKSIHLENGVTLTIPQDGRGFAMSAMGMEDDCPPQQGITRVKKAASSSELTEEQLKKPGSKKKSSTP